jgi:hypothetical protein
LGNYISLDASLVNYPVDLIGRDAGFGSPGSDVEDLSRQSTALSHGVLARLV